MKVLVSIISCARDVSNGVNQAIRETWAGTLDKYGLDYKFFVGVGSTPKSEDLHPNYISEIAHYLAKYPGCDKYSVLDRSLLRDDEILVDSDDSWLYLPYKVKESRKWALAEGYDFIFKIDVDAYLHANKLHGYDPFDYWGARIVEGGFIYAGGWSGYMLSKKAYSLTIDAPITLAAEDCWTSKALQDNGITLQGWAVTPTTRDLAGGHAKITARHILDYHTRASNIIMKPPVIIRVPNRVAPILTRRKAFHTPRTNAVRFGKKPNR